MALINCPECGKQISERAYWCIHCGYPMREDIFPAAAPAPEKTSPAEESVEAAPITYVIKVSKYKSGREGDVIEGNWPRAFPKIDEACPGGTWRAVRYIWKNNGESKLFDKVTIFDVKKQKMCTCRLYELTCVPGSEDIYLNLANYKDTGAYPSYVVLGDVDVLPEGRESYTGISTTGGVKCPQCGSTAVTTGSRGLNWTFGAIGAASTVNRCSVCGFTWYPRG